MKRAGISWRFGVRGRLLLAFLAICMFSLIGAASGIFSLSQVGRYFNHITDDRVPQALSWLELSRQADTVVRAAPALLAVRTEEARVKVWSDVKTQIETVNGRLAELGRQTTDGLRDEQAGLSSLVALLNENLAALNDLVKRRVAVSDRKHSLVRQLMQVNTVALRLIMPGERILKAQVAEWNRGRRQFDSPSAERLAAANAIIDLIPQQDAGSLVEAIHNLLLRMVEVDDQAEIDVLLFPLKRSLADLADVAANAPSNIRKRLTQQVGVFEALAVGANSIAQVRREELSIIAQAEELLATNLKLSGSLTQMVNGLVAQAKADIAEERAQASEIQDLNRNILLAVVILSFLSSVLIVWLYVGRNLISRLTALSDSMLAIAGGDLRVPLPVPGSSDEIGRMAEALKVFRDTAVRLEESNLHEIESTRRRLVDAIENSSEGFAFYDTDDRLVISNRRYRELIGVTSDLNIAPGMPFEAVMRMAADGGLDVEANSRTDEWVAERLFSHRNPEAPRLQRRRDGRWVLISERRTGDGGTVAVCSDITELKQREEELTRKSNALEWLSSQLAKYLSPQVYDAIFQGKQDVQLVSQRKRLTVFFSDLVGFTETTERLESEDLTRLLNQYLTEMSQIARDYGATIDKYMGDAILIFFGDPETRGVKEDALACVKMAIAMRKRMSELQEVWKSSGIETPLRCRTGINTGVCTVGNFGSEDRMEYTIIGSGVNLAARLETACPSSEILISYETHAHVKDQVYCEEQGQITAKGISHPVTTFRVVDLYEDLTKEDRVIHRHTPHLQLQVEMNLMTAEEQREAAAALQDVAARLSNSSEKLEC